MSAFILVVLVGVAFIAWQLYQKKKVSGPGVGVEQKPSAGAVVPNPGMGTQAPPTPLAVTPVGNLTPSTLAYYDPNRKDPVPGSQVDTVDRNSRVLDVPGGWRKILSSRDTLTVPNAHGYILIDAAEPDSEITLDLYLGPKLVASTSGKNMVTLQTTADGDYSVVVQVSNVSGTGTVNRKGV